MSNPNPLERRGIELLIAKATAMGVPVPDEIRRLLSGGAVRNTGAWLWAEANPGVDGPGCCIGDAAKGPEHCTCWTPEWNAEQAEPVWPPNPADLAPLPGMCGDCAFRPGSPERADEWMAEALYGLAGSCPPAAAPTPREPVRIELRDRHGGLKGVALIDAEDAELASYRWYLGTVGYAVRTERIGAGKRRMYYLHREVMGVAHGVRLDVDHRDGNKLDCRRQNLRVGGHNLNLQNRGANSGRDLPRNVYRVKGKRGFIVRVKLGGKQNDLGRFDTAEEADAAARRFRAENMPWSADAEVRPKLTPFFCHDSMRRPVRWRHPDGRTIDGSTSDWQPPIVNGVPYRLDGRAGSLCAGWSAIAAKSEQAAGTTSASREETS